MIKESEIEKCTPEKLAAQSELCRVKGLPHFAPPDGRCYNCLHNIYSDVTHEDGYVTKGRSLSYAQTVLITGCQHCSISYCE